MADEDKFLKIKDGVVTGCDKSATEITIPEGVTKIRKRAFFKCQWLEEITIPNGVTKIGACAFEGCMSLESITIPDSVTEIGEKAFSGCHWVAEIHFGGTVSQWKAVKKGNDWNSGVPACTVHCVGGKTQQTGPVVSGTANGSGPLTIEGGVVTGCDESATEIAIPEGVTEIGAWAFYGCQSLTDITIPDSVTEIGASAFEGCQSLASITIPNDVTEIGANAFLRCQSLASITIPASVTYIGYMAFSGCRSLASITIPNSMTAIGALAFAGCKSLADIRFGGTESQWKAVEKGKYWDRNIPASMVHCTDGETQQTGPVVSGTANGNGPLTIEGGVVTGCDESATEIAIPEGVTEIGEYAFFDCQSLADITIPASVTKIGAHAFYGCQSLAGITIPSSVTEIGYGAFSDCRSLASITIPDSVTEIGAWAFKACESLADIRFGGTESQWKAVEKGKYWNDGVPASTVRCTDGETQQTR